MLFGDCKTYRVASPMVNACACLFSLLVMLALPVSAYGSDPAHEQSGIEPGQVLVVEEGDGGRYWQSDGNGTKRGPRYPGELLKEGVEGCVAVGFVIQPDGVPDAFRVLQFGASRPSREVGRKFAAALVQTLRYRRYLPGPENPRRLPGFAVERAGFGAGPDAERAMKRWSDECRIDDLGAFMRSRTGDAES